MNRCIDLYSYDPTTGAFKWGCVYHVHKKRPYERPPSSCTHDIVSQIYQKAPSSRVLTCLLTFSEMEEPVLACTGPKVSVDKLLM